MSHHTREGRFGSKVGQIGPQMGQIRGLFRSAGAPNALKSDLKKPRICPIWGQSDPLWSQTYLPWYRLSTPLYNVESGHQTCSVTSTIREERDLKSTLNTNSKFINNYFIKMASAPSYKGVRFWTKQWKINTKWGKNIQDDFKKFQICSIWY